MSLLFNEICLYILHTHTHTYIHTYIHPRTSNKFSLFSNRWCSQYCVHIVSDGNASIRKYYKQACNSVNVISPKCKQLFFIALNMSDFVPKKVYLWEILLHYFIQKKSAAEAHRILVETNSGYALLKITQRLVLMLQK